MSHFSNGDGWLVQGRVVMSHQEVDRLAVIQQLVSKQIRQGGAARLLGVTREGREGEESEAYPASAAHILG